MSLYEKLNIMEVDEETKQVVSSYISHCQHKYLGGNRLLSVVPELITHICILYYYRTHSIYEWKVSEDQQLSNIKHAVPGQSFNHHFKLHKLDWFLKFYPNGTKQSKQGNVFLLLYLRSTPEISRMSATCKVWLSELDKGREHYKDFNDKNKYTGWRSGLVKTAEIAKLEQLTFQVTIQIFEIYDKDGNNVTNKYIGLGIDSKQTIAYLRKELQFEKAKVQRLTIEVDELSHRLLRGNYYSDHDEEDDDDDEDNMDEEEESMRTLHEHDGHVTTNSCLTLHTQCSSNVTVVDDDEHKTKDLSMKQYSPKGLSMHGSHKEDVCKCKFEHWLKSTVKLAQYLPSFKKAECNDIRMVEFFDEGCLETDIGIKSAIHRKLIMKKANEFRVAQERFVSVLGTFNQQTLFGCDLKEMMEEKGILRMKELTDCVKQKQDIESVFGFDEKHVHHELVWQIVNSSQQQ